MKCDGDDELDYKVDSIGMMRMMWHHYDRLWCPRLDSFDSISMDSKEIHWTIVNRSMVISLHIHSETIALDRRSMHHYHGWCMNPKSPTDSNNNHFDLFDTFYMHTLNLWMVYWMLIEHRIRDDRMRLMLIQIDNFKEINKRTKKKFEDY